MLAFAGGQRRETPETGITFAAFVLSLATTAAVHFGDIADPATGQRAEPNLPAAAQMIDILAMLRGQDARQPDAPEERQLLEQVLYELRLRFVAGPGGGQAHQPRAGCSRSPSSAPARRTACR